VGQWQYWKPDGTADAERSGEYVDGQRAPAK
jgi:hypothetical protein